MGFLRDIQVKCSGTNGHILWCLFIDLYLHDLHQGPPPRLRLQGSKKGKISSLSAFLSRDLSWWIKIDGGRIGNINDAKLPWKFLILFIKFHPMIYKSPLGYDNLLSTWFLIFLSRHAPRISSAFSESGHKLFSARKCLLKSFSICARCEHSGGMKSPRNFWFSLE